MPGTLVALSNSSDPYPPLEKELRLSRGCLEILKARGCRVQVVTKSDLVMDDASLLASMSATVAITVTTLKDSVCRKLEPGAVLPQRRLLALRYLAREGISVSARIDPIIPGINDSEVLDLVHAVGKAGARHITSSTYKARPDSIRRICRAFPVAGESLNIMLQRGVRVSSSRYLPEDVRADLMQKVKEAAEKEGMSFSACREKMALKAGICCDGTHLLSGIGSR
jgi:DNA repair photolyase